MLRTHEHNKKFQHTLQRSVHFDGIGVHKAENVSLKLLPADPNTGIVFKRVDLAGAPTIKVAYEHTEQVPFCSRITEQGVSVMTLEHLMAALWATEIDNVIIEISAEEVPILDGSAQPFIDAILNVGRVRQNASRHYIRILKPIFIGNEHRFIALKPSDTFSIDFEVDFFSHKKMEPQQYYFEGDGSDFCQSIASARTFGFFEDADKMRQAGIALGASLENVVVIQEGMPMNPEGFRFEKECVKHKVLDAVGDLYLCGYPIIGAYKAKNAGHEFNACALKALFSDQEAWSLESLGAEEPFFPKISATRVSMIPSFSA